MMKRIGKSVTNRHIRPAVKYEVKTHYLDLLDMVAVNLATNKPVVNLKAGGSYVLHLGTVCPRHAVLFCMVNQDLIDAGFCSFTHRIITPLDNDKDVKFMLRFECKEDISLRDLDYGMRITMDDGSYSRWI